MQEENKTTQGKAPEFGIQRLYVKDLSLETPNSPAIFLEEWKPELNLDLETKTQEIDANTHEVVLCVTATVKIQAKVAFIAEVQQAGIFSILHFPKEQMRSMLGAFCPDILYPYAREAITSVVVKAGFPQLYLAPVNFEGMLAEQDAQAVKTDS